MWPRGVNLQPGDFSARELMQRGKAIINITDDESSQHIAMFRSTTGIRSTREYMTRGAGHHVFRQFVAQSPGHLAGAYDNVLLGALYERLFEEAFAPDLSGAVLGGSMTLPELRQALRDLRDPGQLTKLRESFRRSERSILKMAAQERVELSIPSV
jgi:hypothetical protein